MYKNGNPNFSKKMFFPAFASLSYTGVSNIIINQCNILMQLALKSFDVNYE